MPTLRFTAAFDGHSDVAYTNGTREWGRYYSAWFGDDPDTRALLTAELSGNDWRMDYMRLAAENHRTTIRDLDNGDRRISLLELGYNSDVELTSTRVRYMFGWDGDRHEVTLGDNQNGSTFGISLFAAENTLTTGNAYVHNITTGLGSSDADRAIGDRITIGEGGAGSIGSGSGADVVDIRQAYVTSVATTDGNDRVLIGSSGAGTVDTGRGNDVVQSGSGFVGAIVTGSGNDVVRLGAGGAGVVRTGDGNDRIQVLPQGAGQGVAIQGGSGTDTLDFSRIRSEGVTFSLNEGGRFQDLGTGGNIGYLSEASIENLIGTRRNDVLTGDSGDNEIRGGGGRDTLTGGNGNDLLIGNGGADRFVFGAQSGNDRIRGFQDGADLLVLAEQTGGFSSLNIRNAGNDLLIEHDGGSVRLLGEAGTTLTADDFLFA